ncbi:MAG: S16 family serine protease, partial [Actinomycetota bacterium]
TRQISLQQMRTATQEAQFLALSVAGYEPTIEPGEVVIDTILCRVADETGFECIESFPSDEQLDPADTILDVAGNPIGDLDDLSDELAGREPGELVDLRIRRPEVGELDVTIELSSDPDDPDRTIVGFIPFDTSTVDLPFDVSVDTGAIGGPSAGLAFTLALIDELTEGDLTGGVDIAVTGTIDLNGAVGPIGGLEQKVHAVRQHGVDVFLVPAGQIELGEPDPDDPDDGVCRIECLRDAGDGEVEIIPVATLDEALAALIELGGDPVVPVAASGS